MEGATESKTGARPFRRSVFDILEIELEAAHVQIRVQRAETPMGIRAFFLHGPFHLMPPFR